MNAEGISRSQHETGKNYEKNMIYSNFYEEFKYDFQNRLNWSASSYNRSSRTRAASPQDIAKNYENNISDNI